MIYDMPAPRRISQVMYSYYPEIKSYFFPGNNHTLFFGELGSNIDGQMQAGFARTELQLYAVLLALSSWRLSPLLE